MISLIKRLFGKQELKEELRNAINGTIDFDDPDQRIGASLFLVLNGQSSLLGLDLGNIPCDGYYATDKCKGALFGTAIALVMEECDLTNNKAIIDATVAAFVLVYGESEGKPLALATIEASATGYEIISTSEWAIQDTLGAREPGSSTTPMAFYLAAQGMI